MFEHLIVFLAILGGVWLGVRIVTRRAPRPPDEAETPRRIPTRLRLTREGKVFLVLANLALISGLQTGVNLIYLTFSFLAAALFLSLLIVLFAGPNVRIQLTMPREVSVGRPFIATVSVMNRNRWLPAYCLALQHEVPKGLVAEYHKMVLVRLGPREETEYRLPLMAVRRGEYEVSGPTCVTRFPFGFVERGFRDGQEVRVLALPQLGQVHESTTRETLDDSALTSTALSWMHALEDFKGLREYRPGDNLTSIHWRTSARAGQLLVRENTSHYAEKVFLAFLAEFPPESGEPDLVALERGISYAASLAKVLIDGNFAVGFGAFGPRPIRLPMDRGVPHLRRLWREMALLEPVPRGDVRDLVDCRARRDWDGAVVYLITLGTQRGTAREMEELLAGQVGAFRPIDVSSPSFERVFTLPPLKTAWGES